ncbi:SPOR domain-containing protein [Acidovorax soli]|uniref:Sporulation related domain-containing protein n=1 Tax=Acidovorax soli TaxID=592050 RepID=A0A1H4D228_9BURK|nr:SPOR domain-containing protein [Acidovorax soli]SEA66489.1 Sporulation related domain-containing protein [Acidovorax soli]
MKKKQTGGTIIGFIVGVVVGLGAALAVAVYVTKVPVPFLNKGGLRGVDQDAAEAQKNKNWDPNSPLYGKNPARPPAPAAAASVSANGTAPAAEATAARTPASKPATAEAKSATKADAKPAASADPLGDLAKAKSAAVDPFDYFVQAGAFPTQSGADAQRAKLAMLGWEARVSEREQNGRTMYRVRVGPFAKRDDAEQLKEKLEGAGVESAMVRVQR